MRCSSLQFYSTSADPSDPKSHENEGFLKSIWHRLTNHPAHQDNAEGESKSDSSSSKDDKSKKSDDDSKSGGSSSS